MNAGRTNVGNGHHLDVVWIERANQNVSFVAGANATDANRIVNGLAIAKVHRAQAGTGCYTGRDRASEESHDASNLSAS